MDRDKIHQYLESTGETALLMDGFDEAFLGFSYRMNEPVIAVYSWTTMIDILVDRDGMDFDEASEYIDFNILNAWVGEQTPIVVMPVEV
jgi:uncharacterized protein YozE (UPF0346 family)